MLVMLTEETEQTAQALRNMFTVYFSELSQWDDLLELNEWGLPVWVEYGVPMPGTHDECARYNWWIRGDCRRFLIEADGKVAGFVIVNTGPRFLPPDTDFEVLDFFVAHKYRRTGVGQAAARAVFDAFRGRWEVEELVGNRAAVAFWNQVVAGYTGGQYESLDNGARQRFRNDSV